MDQFVINFFQKIYNRYLHMFNVGTILCALVIAELYAWMKTGTQPWLVISVCFILLAAGCYWTHVQKTDPEKFDKTSKEQQESRFLRMFSTALIIFGLPGGEFYQNIFGVLVILAMYVSCLTSPPKVKAAPDAAH
jgi:uncharacterized membrane protein